MRAELRLGFVSGEFVEAVAASIREETPFQRFRSDFFESRIATVALVTLIAIVLVAIFAPLIAPQDPYDALKSGKAAPRQQLRIVT